jgi:hypothetical protein
MAEIIILRIVLLLAALFLGYWIVKKITTSLTAKTNVDEVKMLKEAINVAKNTKGRITVADLAFALEIPLPEAETILTRATEEGLATADVDLDTGTLVYDIPRARVDMDPLQIRTLGSAPLRSSRELE